MSLPTIEKVREHEEMGGLWRVRLEGEPMPRFERLRVRDVHPLNATWPGRWHAATWTPCTPEGDPLPLVERIAELQQTTAHITASGFGQALHNVKVWRERAEQAERELDAHRMASAARRHMVVGLSDTIADLKHVNGELCVKLSLAQVDRDIAERRLAEASSAGVLLGEVERLLGTMKKHSGWGHGEQDRDAAYERGRAEERAAIVKGMDEYSKEASEACARTLETRQVFAEAMDAIATGLQWAIAKIKAGEWSACGENGGENGGDREETEVT